jgi:hypothetical protein
VSSVPTSERSLIHSSPEEMQQKFGEDSIWVYEILRYARVNYDQIDNGVPSTSSEELTGQKVRPK